MTCLFLDVKGVHQREDAEVHSTTLQYLIMPLAAAVLVLPAMSAVRQVQVLVPVAPCCLACLHPHQMQMLSNSSAASHTTLQVRCSSIVAATCHWYVLCYAVTPGKSHKLCIDWSLSQDPCRLFTVLHSRTWLTVACNMAVTQTKVLGNPRAE